VLAFHPSAKRGLPVSADVCRGAASRPRLLPPLQYDQLEDNEDEEGAPRKPQGGDAQQPAAAADSGQAPAAAAAAAAEAAPAGEGAAGAKRDVREAALEAAREKSKKAKAGQPQGWFELKVNTSVYVTGLPEDVTEAELVETFSKCGVIKEDLEVGGWGGGAKVCAQGGKGWATCAARACPSPPASCPAGSGARAEVQVVAELLPDSCCCVPAAPRCPPACLPPACRRAAPASRSTGTRAAGGQRATAWSRT
jgi:hypothetical protein